MKNRCDARCVTPFARRNRTPNDPTCTALCIPTAAVLSTPPPLAPAPRAFPLPPSWAPCCMRCRWPSGHVRKNGWPQREGARAGLDRGAPNKRRTGSITAAACNQHTVFPAPARLLYTRARRAWPPPRGWVGGCARHRPARGGGVGVQASPRPSACGRLRGAGVPPSWSPRERSGRRGTRPPSA